MRKRNWDCLLLNVLDRANLKMVNMGAGKGKTRRVRAQGQTKAEPNPFLVIDTGYNKITRQYDVIEISESITGDTSEHVALEKHDYARMRKAAEELGWARKRKARNSNQAPPLSYLDISVGYNKLTKHYDGIEIRNDVGDENLNAFIWLDRPDYKKVKEKAKELGWEK